jgi:hypothetical protein
MRSMLPSTSPELGFHRSKYRASVWRPGLRLHLGGLLAQTPLLVARALIQSACLRLTFVLYGESKWTMGWFRQKVPWLSRLALFALAVQIVLSFGHVHVNGAAPASAAGMNALAVESNSTAAPGPALPTDRDRNSPAHDLCALCASISLLHSLVLPVPAALAALGEFDRIQFRYASATAVLAQPRSPSQARAPPFA